MKTSAARYWVFFAVGLMGVYGAYAGWKRYQEAADVAGVAVAAKGETLFADPVRHFTLTERSGEAFDSQELEGEVWVASFFFSSCPGACLKMNSAIAQLQQELADVPVRFVSITVDPATDTPERLREYAQHFQADPQRWLFLTGEEDDLRRLAVEDFKVAFGPSAHSDRLLLVDRQMRVQGAFRSTEDAQLVLFKRKLAELTRGT